MYLFIPEDYLLVYVYMHVCKYTRGVYVCMYVCMYVCTYVSKPEDYLLLYICKYVCLYLTSLQYVC